MSLSSFFLDKDHKVHFVALLLKARINFRFPLFTQEEVSIVGFDHFL